MEKQNIKNLFWHIITTVIITLTAVFTVWVYAAFVEPSVGPNSSDQDFAQNILGANNADNDFDSSLVASNSNGSIIEQLEYIVNRTSTTECGESTTSFQTSCYVDDTARYLTTDLCNEVKENSCFIPTDNGYYAFNTECADSTTTAKTNCYVDDTAKYVNASVCSAGSSTGYCYMNTATFSAMDADLVVSNIKNGVNILGVTGAISSAEDNQDYPDLMHIASFIEPSVAPADYDQDFTQNIIGANNADNDFDSSSVAANRDGSVMERVKYIIGWLNSGVPLYSSECGESTTATQTSCYVDDTSRYITTDLCNETKENQCFVPTNNSYYAFGAECSNSTTSTQTNCYVDDTARYVDNNTCSADANTGYCYVNASDFSTFDTDLVASNIKTGVTIFGIAGTFVPLCGNGTIEPPEVCDDGNVSWTAGNCSPNCSRVNYYTFPSNITQGLNVYARNDYCKVQGWTKETNNSGWTYSINTWVSPCSIMNRTYYYGNYFFPSTTSSSFSSYYCANCGQYAQYYNAAYMQINSMGTYTVTYINNMTITDPAFSGTCTFNNLSMATTELWCSD
jgi:cysteine-rich repeat protein